MKTFPGLRYVEMVMAESMRLYPPAWAMGRYARNDFQLGEFFLAGQDHGADEPVHHASRCAILSRSTALRSRAIHARGKARRAKFTYFPFGAGFAAVHRRVFCMDGRRAVAGDVGAEVEDEAGPGSPSRTGASDHVAAEVWDARCERRSPTLESSYFIALQGYISANMSRVIFPAPRRRGSKARYRQLVV